MSPQIPPSKKINPPLFITVLLVAAGLLGSYQIYSAYYAKLETPSIEPTAPKSGIEGQVTIGPNCPVQKVPADPNCADKPYQARLRIIDTNGKEITVFTTKADGSFYLELPPGFYIIENASTSSLPRLPVLPFRIIPESISLINLVYDSGIR